MRHRSGRSPRQPRSRASSPRTRKDLIAIMADHGVPYVATVNLAYLDDFEKKDQNGRRNLGVPLYRDFYALCPGHKVSSASIIDMSRKMVKSRMWPLVEITDHGRKWDLPIPGETIPVEEVLKSQGRFRVAKDYSLIEEVVDDRLAEDPFPMSFSCRVHPSPVRKVRPGHCGSGIYRFSGFQGPGSPGPWESTRRCCGSIFPD